MTDTGSADARKNVFAGSLPAWGALILSIGVAIWNGRIITHPARRQPTPAAAAWLLVAATLAAKGTRTWVSDATASTFGTTVAGGGANTVPVVSNGTNWIIG